MLKGSTNPKLSEKGGFSPILIVVLLLAVAGAGILVAKQELFTSPKTSIQPMKEKFGISVSTPDKWFAQETSNTFVITPTKMTEEELKLGEWAGNPGGRVVVHKLAINKLLKNRETNSISVKDLLEKLSLENPNNVPGYPTYKGAPKRQIAGGAIEVNPSTPPLTVSYGPGALEEEYWLASNGNLYTIFVYFPHDKTQHSAFEQNLSAILQSLEIN